jgi:uncharacterized protein DUF4232
VTQRRILMGLGLLAALVAGPHNAARASAPARVVARCDTAQLTIAPDYGEGGAGHIGLIFLVHNRSGQTCTLYGYPGAQLLDAAYRPLPTHLRWGTGYLAGNPPRRLVTLKPGTDAYFSLEWVHIPSPGQACPTAPFVRITPPNAYTSTIVWAGQGGIDACGGNLIAAPVEPGEFSFGVVPAP